MGVLIQSTKGKNLVTGSHSVYVAVQYSVEGALCWHGGVMAGAGEMIGTSLFH